MMTMQQMRNIMYVFAVFLQISTFYVRKSGYFLDHEKNEEHNHTNDTTEIKTFSCEENILYIAAFLWCAVGCTVYSSIFATFILEKIVQRTITVKL